MPSKLQRLAVIYGATPERAAFPIVEHLGDEMQIPLPDQGIGFVRIKVQSRPARLLGGCHWNCEMSESKQPRGFCIEDGIYLFSRCRVLPVASCATLRCL